MKTKPKNFVTSEKTLQHAELISNRIRKRHRHLSRKFKRQNIDCFRLYDWDIPEVRAVVDWYQGHLVVGEYVRLQTSSGWLPAIAKAVAQSLNVPAEKVHVKKRQTNTKTGPRYAKMSSKGIQFEVNERDLKFWINLDDFLDTGLFSDHRDTRVIIRNLAKGQSFLNLFAYTGAFTCAAAMGEAQGTVTVDRNETYLKWAKDNMKLNGLLGNNHKFVQSDVAKYLKRAARDGKCFTLAFVDPPSFFKDHNNKTAFDINRDHPGLLRQVFKVMVPGAKVIFSTNHQRFKPQFEGLRVKNLKELTPKTIPEDYRNQLIHRCWEMTTK